MNSVLKGVKEETCRGLKGRLQGRRSRRLQMFPDHTIGYIMGAFTGNMARRVVWSKPEQMWKTVDDD